MMAETCSTKSIKKVVTMFITSFYVLPIALLTT